jgi:gliding motility-associated-like protein
MTTMKLKIYITAIFILCFYAINAQNLNLSTVSTENTNCNGIGCEYNGPSILINEVMMTPAQFDGSIYGITPSHNPDINCRGEWIELYNPNLCESIDISCYYLGNSAYEGSYAYPGGFVLPEGTVVPPRGFVVVRGITAPIVPTSLLIENGGNTIEIIVEDEERICIGGGYRLWFPNAGGWFAFYDNNGVPQDAISWASNSTGDIPACVPSPGGECNFSGTLVAYNSIDTDRKTYISSSSPSTNLTFRRLPDGEAWQTNSPSSPTYGTCNMTCTEEPIITCNGTTTVSVSGGTPPYSYLWNDSQNQYTQTATGLCEGTYCVTVTDNSSNTASICVEVINSILSVNASSSPVTICEGNTINFDATYSQGQSPYQFLWSGPNSYNSTESNPSITDCSTANEGTYLITVTDTYGCSGTASTSVNVNINPIPLAENDGPLCTGEDLQLSVQNFSSYSWSGPDGFTSNAQNPTILPFSENNAGPYTVTVTNEYGCTANSTTIVEALQSPYLTIDSEIFFCQGDYITFNCSPSGLTNYQWTGPLSFNSSTQNATINNCYPSQSGNYTVTAIGTNGCSSTAEIDINISPTVDATINIVPPLCYNDPDYILTAATNGGTWLGPGVNQNLFDPSDAGCGSHEVTYFISNEACNDTAQTTIDVYENISVINFTDNICDGTYTEYYVSFDIINHLGNPTVFLMDIGTGFNEYTESILLTYPSQTPYSITITDAENQCDQYIFNGVRDCGCFTAAGNMSSLQPISLCYGDCSDIVTHSGNEYLDADDTFGFILHDGSSPINILTTSLTPEFCFHLIPGLSFGTTYYISAVAGNEVSPGIPDYNDPCISISQGTPVIWYENPMAHINTEDFTICGMEASFSAEPPSAGMTGNWSSDSNFWPANETTQTSPDISIFVDSYGTQTFYWHINNANCVGTDEIHIEFIEIPNAYAGSNFSVCGSNTELNAVLSYPSSTGLWTGDGIFSNSTSPETSVTINSVPGPYTFTWRETNGDCWDEDLVVVNFIPTPNPMIFPVTDTICGNIYQLSASNVQGEGQWSAYIDDVLLQPAPNYIQGIDNPVTQVIIPNYLEDHLDVEFIWTETTMNAGVECTATASTTITFARIPIASVGASDEIEICGNSVQLNADITGSEFGEYTWISNQLTVEFDDPTLPNATLTMLSQGSFGNSAHVRAPIIWAIQNYGCASVDTLWITFYDRPVANAGIDKAICGNFFELGAVFDIPETESYSPSGMWSVYERPIPSAAANIVQQNEDSTNVSVSPVGIWSFIFRENNSYLPSCYSTDTIIVEFVETPIISAGEDKDVCGNCTDLEAISGGFNGTWLDNSSSFDDYTNPQTPVCHNGYGPIVFAWMESNTAETQNYSCSAQDEVTITFWQIPDATILTDTADNYTCGLSFDRLRAENPGSGITGYWFTNSPGTIYGDEFDFFTWTTVSEYGYHDFYWIEETGPVLNPGFCNDTAGPLTIHFIQIPTANAGIDTLFCGKSGYLNAIPSIGTGVWSNPSIENITIENINDPGTYVNSEIYNTDNPDISEFEFTWIESNFGLCTDIDTVYVTFARIPESDIDIIPPKCFGEPATIAATEDSLQQYTWNFFSGTIDTTTTNPASGEYENFVFWNSTDTLHRISLYATNHWGCQSPITIDTVYEPAIPNFDVTLVLDTCMLGKGGIIFGDTLSNTSFFWLDTTVGPAPGTPITSVYEIPVGEYYIRTSYLTPNTTHYAYYLTTFGTANCIDTLLYEIEPIGMIEAIIEISTATDMGELVAPEATVIFLNNSIYDNVGKRCEWHFGDETTEKNCDPQIEHIYTEAGCYEPFLIVMNRDLPVCRDTAFLETCIPIDNASEIEIPNIFSPNGDGINDFFQVKAQTLRTFSGIIVNRWGRTVFEWENWQDYEAGWNGKLNGGTEASPGVYYFVIKAVGMDDQEYEMQGPLHLIDK